jgi:hypothetical protein
MAVSCKYGDEPADSGATELDNLFSYLLFISHDHTSARVA